MTETGFASMARFARSQATGRTGTRGHVPFGLSALAVAAVAAAAGELQAVSPQRETAWPWLVLAALLGLLGVRLVEHGLPYGAGVAGPAAGQEESVCAGWESLPLRQRRGGLTLMALGGVASIAAAVLLAISAAQANLATAIWVLGVEAALLGAVALSPVTLRRPRLRRPGRAVLVELGALLLVLGLGLGLRLPNLAAVPPNVHGDEADVGLLARDVLAGRMPLIFGTAPAAEAAAVTFSIHAASMQLFGDNLFGLRMAAVVEGMLSILLLYLLTRRLWGMRAAVLAAALLAVAAWHIQFSRSGFHYMQGVVATLLVLYFLVRATQDGRLLDWLACGFAIGLSIEVYYAARLAPVIVAVYVAYRLVSERAAFLRLHWRGLLTLSFGALVFLAPMGPVYGRSEGSFTQRAMAVLVSSPSNLEHEFHAYHVDTLQEVLAIQMARTLAAFHILGETSLEYGHPAPLFDPVTGALLAIGALGVLFRPLSARGVMLAAWVWLALLLGSVLTVDALFSPHILVAVPALVLASALVLEITWRGVSQLAGRAGTLAFGCVVVAALAVALYANVRDFFQVQVVERQPAGRFTILASVATATNAAYRLYVVGRGDWTLTYSTPRFLIPNPDAVDVRDKPLALPLDRIPAVKGAAFLVESGAPGSPERLQAIHAAYPDGREEVVFERPGQPVLTKYTVEHSELVAANPRAEVESK